MTARVPIADQVAEVERELEMRAQVYPGLIARGRLGDHDARRQVGDLQAALATLRFVQQHAEAIKRLVRYLAAADLGPREQPSEEERAALRAHPAVATLLAAFPGADLGAIAPVRFPAPPPEQLDLLSGQAD